MFIPSSLSRIQRFFDSINTVLNLIVRSSSVDLFLGVALILNLSLASEICLLRSDNSEFQYGLE